ncbi:uncharacterized protein LOC135164154 [Diachasmimorpha longicaudata]|uniref:uncharacterized protein LOC135164154 n=1 Tax=Diachasmimorpha longicaudata TaxID=58733 RepID=UPI0030B89F13
MRWEDWSDKRTITRKMVKVGSDSDGSTLVVGRCWVEDSIIPCKTRPTQGIAFCAYNNREINKYSYKVLLMDRDDYEWVKVKNLQIPDNAIVVGRTKESDPLYVGRTIHNDVDVAGKVPHSTGFLHYPYYHTEYITRSYEILVEKN